MLKQKANLHQLFSQFHDYSNKLTFESTCQLIHIQNIDQNNRIWQRVRGLGKYGDTDGASRVHAINGLWFPYEYATLYIIRSQRNVSSE